MLKNVCILLLLHTKTTKPNAMKFRVPRIPGPAKIETYYTE